jgi:hypothetical protein
MKTGNAKYVENVGRYHKFPYNKLLVQNTPLEDQARKDKGLPVRPFKSPLRGVWEGAQNRGIREGADRSKALARICSGSTPSLGSAGSSSEWRSSLAKFGQTSLYSSAKESLHSLEAARMEHKRLCNAALEEERRQIAEEAVQDREDEIRQWQMEEQTALEAKSNARQAAERLAERGRALKRGGAVGMLSEEAGGEVAADDRKDSVEMDFIEKVNQMSSYLDMKFKEMPLNSPAAAER